MLHCKIPICCLVVLVLVLICTAADTKQMIINGTIKFMEKPAPFPVGSCLTVKFEDASRADVASIEIAKKIFRASELTLVGDVLPFRMTFPKPAPSEYSISATINVKWCAENGNDWLHSGDYLTTTQFNVKVEAEKHLYKESIELEHYKSESPNAHNTKRGDDPCRYAPCKNSICRSSPDGTYVCTKVSRVPCAVPMCAAVFSPICANNGKTYDNDCLMLADNCHGGIKSDLRKVHEGECYTKRAMLGGVLFGACIVLLTIVGFFAIFMIWRRNRRMKMREMGAGSIKKVAPLGM